jgi:hypothetical protein
MQATGSAVNSTGGETAVLAIAALDTTAPIPASRSQAPTPAQNDMLTAYAPAQDPESQRALQMIIERETTASLPKTKPAATGLVPAARTASVTGDGGLTTLKGIFDQTFGAVDAAQQQPMAAALAAKAAAMPSQSFTARDSELTAPDFEHVADIFAQPVSLSSEKFGVMTPHDEGDFSPATEMGAFAGKVAFDKKPGFEQNSDTFIKGPLLVTVR